MTIQTFVLFALYSALLVAVTVPMGRWMHLVFEEASHFMSRALGPVEKAIYRLGGVDASEEMPWTIYTGSMVLFTVVTLLMTYAIQRLQGFLPWNPQGFGTDRAAAGATPMTPDLAFNTAVSFSTNTNWQSYTPETTMSYFTEMVGLATHNFFSAAVGIVLAIAVVRGFARQQVRTLGNFWADLVRCTLYVLLPLSVISALFLCWQGVPQNLHPYTQVATLEGAAQSIGQGPVASQEAIKMLGTNGGGFFNANSAHPYENPTPLSNLFQMLLIFAIPAGLTYTFGLMVRDRRQGWAIFAAMYVLFAVGWGICSVAEQNGNPNVAGLHVDQQMSAMQSGGNMEGKEVRFGIKDSALFATITTDASCGAVNCMHDSLTPLGGMVPLVNIQLGELVFGGVGSGLYDMLVFAVLTVFIAGLMVGRTPEYLGKKIEQKEVKMAMLSALILCFSILVFTAIASVLPIAKDSYWNPGGAPTTNLNNGGPHGFSELLYAFTSATGNNGSAFAGISVNTPFFNLLLGLAMILGRFFFIVPTMAIAGSLAAKKYVPPSAGTFPTHSGLFVILLLSVILIVGALTFFPALSLGPIVEQLQMVSGNKLY